MLCVGDGRVTRTFTNNDMYSDDDVFIADSASTPPPPPPRHPRKPSRMPRPRRGVDRDQADDDNDDIRSIIQVCCIAHTVLWC